MLTKENLNHLVQVLQWHLRNHHQIPLLVSQESSIEVQSYQQEMVLTDLFTEVNIWEDGEGFWAEVEATEPVLMDCAET